eukprot:jgi/Phyca11/124593/e_gw1.54.202.1
MLCDVEPTKVARVFDPRHKLKLSLEAYVAVQPRRDESKGFEPFKPLLFSGDQPPIFSIRGKAGKTSTVTKPFATSMPNWCWMYWKMVTVSRQVVSRWGRLHRVL